MDIQLKARAAVWIRHTLDKSLSLAENTEIIEWKCVKTRSAMQSGSDGYHAQQRSHIQV